MKMRGNRFVYLIALSSVVSACKKTESRQPALSVELAMMSQCPFGNRALKSLLAAQQLAPDLLEFQVSYLGQVQDGRPVSVRGDSELTGDKLGLCAQKRLNKSSDRAQFFGCLSERYETLPQGWEECAMNLKLDVSALRSCSEGPEGKQLVIESFHKAVSAGITSSPTLLVDGKPYTGSRHSKAIAVEACEKAKSKSLNCEELRTSTDTFTLVTDERCTKPECSSGVLEEKLISFLPPSNLEKVDWSDFSERSDSWKPALPAMVLSEQQSNDSELLELLGRALLPLPGGRKVVNFGTWDPTGEICGNGLDDDGDQATDCSDVKCKQTQACLPIVPDQILVFLDEGGEYSARGTEALAELATSFGEHRDKVKLKLVQVGRRTKNGWQPARGLSVQPMSAEQACIQSYAGGWEAVKFSRCVQTGGKVLECREQALAKIKARNSVMASVQQCSTGTQATELLQSNYQLAAALPVPRTPYFLINQKEQIESYSPSNLKKAFCDLNALNTACVQDSRANQ